MVQFALVTSASGPRSSLIPGLGTRPVRHLSSSSWHQRTPRASVLPGARNGSGFTRGHRAAGSPHQHQRAIFRRVLTSGGAGRRRSFGRRRAPGGTSNVRPAPAGASTRRVRGVVAAAEVPSSTALSRGRTGRGACRCLLGTRAAATTGRWWRPERHRDALGLTEGLVDRGVSRHHLDARPAAIIVRAVCRSMGRPTGRDWPRHDGPCCSNSPELVHWPGPSVHGD